MSVENLKKYGQLCAENEEVRKKAKEIGISDMDGQIAYAKSLGLDISKGDFESLAKEAGYEKKDELSEDELKKVAGGVFTITVSAIMAASIAVAGAAGATAVNLPGW